MIQLYFVWGWLCVWKTERTSQKMSAMRNSSGAFTFLYTLNFKSVKQFKKNSANAIILDVPFFLLIKKICARTHAHTHTHTHTLYVFFHVLARDLQSVTLNCYVQTGSCFCGPSQTFSTINNNGRDILYIINLSRYSYDVSVIFV